MRRTITILALKVKTTKTELPFSANTRANHSMEIIFFIWKSIKTFLYWWKFGAKLLEKIKALTY